MDVSKITSSTNLNRFTAEGGLNQVVQDFTAIRKTIRTGDLRTARKALLTFQQDLQKMPQTSPLRSLFVEGGPFRGDLQTVQAAVESGDVSKTQAAMKRLLAAIEKLIAANR